MRFSALLIALCFIAGCTSDASDRLVGTWEPASEAGGPQMRYTFFADGRARLLARPELGEPQSFEARFTVSGDTVLTLSDSEGTERFGFSLAKDTLRLTSPATGEAAAFVRVQGDS